MSLFNNKISTGNKKKNNPKTGCCDDIVPSPKVVNVLQNDTEAKKSRK